MFFLKFLVLTIRSIEHRPDLVIEGLIVQIVDFNSLEVLFGVKISFGNEEGLSQD
jgi:hypothetical protein